MTQSVNFELRRDEALRNRWERETTRRRLRRRMIKCQSQHVAESIRGRRAGPTFVCHDGWESKTQNPPRSYVFLQTKRTK